jgi:hypothetical protein
MDLTLQGEIMNTEVMATMLQKMWHPISPPGCTSDFIDHPPRRDKAVEIGIVLEHCFAFFYWLKWHANREPSLPPPNLLTIDWHDDVGGDCDFTPETLNQLNPKNENELSLSCWAGLRSRNDGQLTPAQYLNAIGDVSVILKQHQEAENMENRHRTQTDRYGKAHQIHYFNSPEDFLQSHANYPPHSLILDLDLDYFTSEAPSGEHGAQKRVSDREIKRFVSPQGPLMQWILPRLDGFTIALEPKFCGGVGNCAHILNVISSTLCDPPLLSAGMKWR